MSLLNHKWLFGINKVEVEVEVLKTNYEDTLFVSIID